MLASVAAILMRHAQREHSVDLQPLIPMCYLRWWGFRGEESDEIGFRRAVWSAATAVTLLSAAATAQAAGQKPNILILWGDDIGYWNVSIYNQGMMGYKTPNPSQKAGTFSLDAVLQALQTPARQNN